MQSQRLPFYNTDKVCSYNAPWSMICGARGLGKTYGFTRDAVKRFVRTAKHALDTGEQFIYLRRYQTELAARVTFFDTIGQEFPDWDFRINGMRGEASPVSEREEKKREWRTVVHFIALSQATGKKSQDFNKVTSIIFDEFIIEKGFTHYINGSNEPAVFQNFYNTVDRYRGVVKVYFLSNSVAMNNPYFLRYKIDPSTGEEFIKRNKLTTGRHFLVAHLADAKDFANAVRETEFGQFLAETDPDYLSYAVDNMFADNHDELVKPKNPEAKYRFSLETRAGTFSVWKETLGRKWYAQAKRPKNEVIITLIPENMSNKKGLALPSDELIRKLRTAWRTSNLWFDHPMTRNAFMEVFK